MSPPQTASQAAIPFIKLTPDLVDHLSVFQNDREVDGFHWLGTGRVNSGMGMKFGPVKEAIKRLLVFLAQSPSKWFPPVPFGFQNMAVRQKCVAHFPLPGSLR